MILLSLVFMMGVGMRGTTPVNGAVTALCYVLSCFAVKVQVCPNRLIALPLSEILISPFPLSSHSVTSLGGILRMCAITNLLYFIFRTRLRIHLDACARRCTRVDIRCRCAMISCCLARVARL